MIKRKLSFKWFGSLSNLSFRRKSDAGKDSAQKDDAVDHPSAGETSIDDMDARPRCPSYVRSSDMYTHMGTMPRHQKQKEKSSKAKGQEQRSVKVKAKTKNSQLSRSQSMKPSMDYVCESPLLSVLSGKDYSTLEQTTVNPKPTASDPEENKAKNISDPAVESTSEVSKDQPIQAQKPTQIKELQTVAASQCLTDPSSSKPSGDPDAPQDVPLSMESKPALPTKRASKKDTVAPQKSLSAVLENTETLTKVEECEEKICLRLDEAEKNESQTGTTDKQGEYVEIKTKRLGETLRAHSAYESLAWTIVILQVNYITQNFSRSHG
ncbi:hypothetical protein AOLI_G00226080 [Acnodon oligacanthus]